MLHASNTHATKLPHRALFPPTSSIRNKIKVSLHLSIPFVVPERPFPQQTIEPTVPRENQRAIPNLLGTRAGRASLRALAKHECAAYTYLALRAGKPASTPARLLHRYSGWKRARARAQIYERAAQMGEESPAAAAACNWSATYAVNV